MNKLVLCIFPIDETTDFLHPIYDAISSVSVKFNGVRIDTTNEEEVDKLKKELLSLSDNITIVFLGHGASHCLYGTPTVEKNRLFKKEDLTIIKNKINFIFSCNSKDLLDNIEALKYIGFGDMPTEFNEITSERALNDASYLEGIIEQDINIYKEVIVDIIAKSIKESKFLSLEDLYRNIKLFANISIVDILTKKNSPNFRMIADLIYEWKDNMTFKYNK